MTQASTTTPLECWHGNNGNKGVLYILQYFRTRTSPSDDLVPYPGDSSKGLSFPSAEMQMAYFTVPSDRSSGF